MGLQELVRERIVRAKEWFLDLAVHTQLIVVAGAIAGGAAFGSGSHVQQTRKAEFQPMAFSEYEQLEDIEKNGGQAMNNVTWVNAGATDYANKIFEAYNSDNILEAPMQANERVSRWWFAYNLKNITGSNNGEHRRNLTDFAQLVPQKARAMLADMSDLRNASELSSNLSTMANATWDRYFDEDGHMESELVCESTEDGVDCHTELEYECDSYTYIWTYKPEEGKALALALNGLKEKVPSITRYPILVSPKTKEKNEAVIKRSFEKEQGREPTKEEMLQQAHLYKTASHYEGNIDNAVTLWQVLSNNNANSWNQMQHTAKTVKKVTDCSYAAPPNEYQFIDQLQANINGVIEKERAISAPTVQLIARVNRIEKMVHAYVARSFPKPEQENNIDSVFAKMPLDELEDKLIDSTRIMYKDMFPQGLPTTEYKGYIVFLMTLLGTALGGGIGFVIDAGLEGVAYKRNQRKYNSF